MKKESQKGLFLFYAYVYINVFCKGIGLSNDSKVYLIMLLLGIIALIIKFFNDSYSRKDFFKILIVTIIGVFSFLFTTKPTLLLTCIFLISMKNANIKKIFKDMCKIRGLTFFLMIFLALTGIIENYSVTMWRNGQLDTRYSLGFGHPNTLHLSLFLFVALYIYVRYEKINFIDYLFVILLNLFIFSFSGSRTGFLVTMLLIFLCFLSKLRVRTINNLLIKSPKFIFTFLIVLSFVTAKLYGQYGILDKLNSIFTGRIEYSHYYLTNYGFSFFGHNNISATNAFFDNGYLYLYIQFGIIGFLFISYLLIKVFKMVEKERNLGKAVLLITFLVYLFTESFTPNIFMNIILIFSYNELFDDSKGDGLQCLTKN